MIRFGLRLTLRGGREAAARLIVICAAVAIGVALLLSTLAGLNAMHTQNARFGWLETGAQGVSESHRPVPGSDPEWWLLSADEYAGTQIGRVDVAATGARSPIPPGLPRLPSAGEYYASPALAALLRTLPNAELAARYPGHLVATIGDAGLPSPDSLIVVVGRSVADLSAQPRATEITEISTTSPSGCNGPCYDIGFNARSIDLILSVVSAAILFPVLIFIGAATRLSAARRDQRFAAMRLVGATPRQIALIAAVESTLAASIGVLLGFGLFAAFQPLIARVPFTGTRFFAHDMALSMPDVLAVALGVPIAAAVAARFALRRVIVSPLGVSRRVTPQPPSAWRVLPVVAGIAELAYFVAQGRPATTDGQIMAFLPGILITMSGLVFAGPWLTMIGSRALAVRARRPAALIAARRLSDNPQAGFRAISGLVLSLFVASVAFGIILSFDAHRGGSTSYSPAEQATIVDDLTVFADRGPTAPVRALPAGLAGTLHAIAGVRAVTPLHAGPEFGVMPATTGPPPVGAADPFSVLVECADLVGATALGSCAPGAATAAVADPSFAQLQGPGGTVWQAAPESPGSVAALPLATLVVTTDGTRHAVEQVRTLLAQRMPSHDGFAPLTIAEDRAQSADTKRSQGYERLADVVILTSLPIAGCTLAVSVVAGLNDRRRPFGLLRLSGTPLTVLRRVVALEAAVPLLVSAVVSIAVGFLTAYLFLRAQMSETLVPPGIGYYATVVAGLVASLAIIASTMPLLDRTTATETTRTD